MIRGVSSPMADQGGESVGDVDATLDLLARARAGDDEALTRLFERHIPLLKRWASGRLPRWARQIADTSDLVQETIIATLRNLPSFEVRGEGALQAYLRSALINRVRNEMRRALLRPPASEIDSQLPHDGTSPLEAAIGSQTLQRYEAALARLAEDEREAVVTRVEFGLSYAEVAEALGKPSADAARMAVVRALLKLEKEMGLPD
jgi:RNA polymerase sigma-70 factor (ECF subfamily)